MRKYLATALIVALVAFSAPAFAVTNPFMDIPMGHWAYDAVGQLAARGILSGFPDGMYRGNQPTTRFEMASALARSLAVLDMTKASRQDVEMLMRLVVEFKDELDALGVRVDQLDSRVSALHNRLGGWRLSGWLRMDLESWRRNDIDAVTPDSVNGAALQFNAHRARLNIEKWFGDNESIYFRAELRNDNQPFNGSGLSMARFWVDFPVFFDFLGTVGRFYWNWEAPYYFDTAGTSAMVTAPWFAGTNDGVGLRRNFALGSFSFYASRSVANPGAAVVAPTSANPWWLALRFEVQPTERFALDLGAHARVSDREDLAPGTAGADYDTTTIFGGLRFNFNQDINFGGVYYHQLNSYRDSVGPNFALQDTRAFRVHASVSQNLLRFSSLWLGYDDVEQGFMTRASFASGMFLGLDQAGDNKMVGGVTFSTMPYDMKAFRVGATQQWNNSWRTWLYFAHHTFSDASTNIVTGNLQDLNAFQLGAGVEYRLNPFVAFALTYVNTDWNRDEYDWMDNHVVRFTTNITF